MRIILVLLFSAFTFTTNAQKLSGTVYNSTGDLLPFASITIKGSSIGASANDKAKFSFNVSAGTYTVVCQHIGYTSVEKNVTIKDDTEISFILPDQKLTLPDVIVKTGGEDPAYEIIRNAIKQRAKYNNQVKEFTCELYGKDIIKLRKLPNKIFGKKIPDEDVKSIGLDSAGKGIMYLSESVSKIAAQEPDKFKMEVLSSRVSGSGSFGFTFPAFISLYENNVTVFSTAFNPRGFVSPIANNALNFYNYKFMGNFWEDGKAVNVIKVTPKRTYEPLFSGIINITDNDWRIHSFDLLLTKTAQLEIMDSLQITQLHVPINQDTWRVKNQLLHFNFNQFGIDAIGNFLSVYSDYNIQPNFGKKYFDRVVIKYDTGVNKRPVAYWDSIRPVPLEREEQKDYAVKDSIYFSTKDSILSKRSIDSLNKNQPKIRVIDAFWKGISRRKYAETKSYRWGMNPILKNLEYNFAEGLVVNFQPFYHSYLRRWRKSVSFEPNLRYGFSNTHFNAWGKLTLRNRSQQPDQEMKNEVWVLAGGKRVSNFFQESTLLPLSNSISSLLWGNNFMKTYENYFGSVRFTKRYESGFRFSVNAEFEDRNPIENTTNFTLVKKDSVNITPNYPTEILASQFERHQSMNVGLELSFRPGQRYIQYPTGKVSLGSKYPLLTLSYKKGIKDLFGSDADFDQVKFTINDDKNFKLLGLMKYKFGVGGFLNNKIVPVQDMQHFNSNYSRSDVNRSLDYVNGFQLAKYYGNSTASNSYAFGFVEHHFNGLLTNKIPAFKKLNWNLVAGGNGLVTKDKKQYLEVFAGIENILKILRIDYVIAYENGRKPVMGLRFGPGGIIGNAIVNSISNSRNSGGGASVEIGF